ncbi:MAG: hypothetical protein GTO14_19235 [Anaerolineales bacterium]|nr:hypothetical protein [Anaerolineales bacterium]
MIDGNTYQRDLIILPDRVLPNWWRLEGHSLANEDLQQALPGPPDVLVIGTGVFSRMNVPEEVHRDVEKAGVEVMVLPTKEACESYNRLREEKFVVAALHLTC